MPHGEEPVRNRKAQVVLVELDESRVQRGGFAHAASEGVCLELKPAAQDGQTEGQQLQTERQEVNTQTAGKVKVKTRGAATPITSL